MCCAGLIRTTRRTSACRTGPSSGCRRHGGRQGSHLRAALLEGRFTGGQLQQRPRERRHLRSRYWSSPTKARWVSAASAASCSIRASWPWSIRGTRTARFRGPRRICQQADVERPRGRGLVLPGETDLEMFDRPQNNRHRRTRLKAESSDLLTSVWSKVRDFTDRLLFFRCRGIIFAPTGLVFIAAGVRGPRQHSVWPALRPAPPADSRWSSPVHSGIRVCPPAGRGCRAPGAGRVR